MSEKINMNKNIFVCKVFADISDYKKMALSNTAFGTIIQNCTKTMVLGEAGKGKEKICEEAEYKGN
ncbi:TPA: hypothetical protein ACH3IE_005020 [Salmonella enterica subsp. enterica serovar Paratyphi B]|nr:hypothetical protein [Salmonella enterica]EKZ3297871.1 hypothetical protein [Salmonella enterica]